MPPRHRSSFRPRTAANTRKGGSSTYRATANGPSIGQPVEITVDRLSHDGRGIGAYQGKTLFVEGALPDETVVASVTADHSRFTEARAKSWLNTSPHRVEPACQHYPRCGGCQLQHCDASSQLAFKQTAVLDQLRRWGGVEPRELLPAIESVASGYRKRARFSVWYERDGRLSLGFREEGSKQLVHVSQCLVLDPSLNGLLPPLQRWLQGLRARRAVAHIELIAADTVNACVIRHTQPLHGQDLEALAEIAREFNVEIWLQQASKRDAGGTGALRRVCGEVCDPRLHYELPEFDLRLGFHPRDFTQVNSAVNRAMVNQAVSLLSVDTDSAVVDLFCGIGNFTLPLARRAGRVVGVEAAESMVERGRENALANGVGNAEFVACDLEGSAGALKRIASQAGAVLLDPPRAGARGVMPLLAQLPAERIVYVSCNPATLARDSKIMAEQGYRLESLGIMDMFPHTAHVESMALFLRD